MQAVKQVRPRQFLKTSLNRHRELKEKRFRNTGWTFALLLFFAPQQFIMSGPFNSASADTISPNITSGGKVYSEERPNKEFFGSGMSGRLSEASYLRFSGEQAMDDGDLPLALKKLSKAVQLDPGDPTGHMIYARAMTSKINRALRKNEKIDDQLLSDCIEEWKLIWRHDADTSEQMEAKAQGRRLARIAKMINIQNQGKLAIKDRKMLDRKNAPMLADRDERKRESEEFQFQSMDRNVGRKLAGKDQPAQEDQ